MLIITIVIFTGKLSIMVAEIKKIIALTCYAFAVT
jgi:hypothetical protein